MTESAFPEGKDERSDTGLAQLDLDMTVGNIWKQMLRFSVPTAIGLLFQQLYNTVDSIIVGRFVGDNALAAVGSAGPILNLMIVLFIGISVGASIMVSQYFGAQKREELSKAIGCCITLTGAASLLIMVIGPLTAGPLLRLLNTPESIIAWCEEYLTIIFLGVLGGGYYNILSGVMRGLGDSASALIFLLWPRWSISCWTMSSWQSWGWGWPALPGRP